MGEEIEGGDAQNEAPDRAASQKEPTNEKAPPETQLKMLALLLIAAYILSDGEVLNQFGLTSDPPAPDPQPEHWPAEWAGTQVVCVHWPAAVWPTDEVPLPEIHRTIGTAGEPPNQIPTTEPGTAIECVGGITNASTVEEATRQAAASAGWSVESHDEYLGIIIDDIRAHGMGALEPGETREWEFWQGETIGAQSVDQARMASESWVVWRIVSN